MSHLGVSCLMVVLMMAPVCSNGQDVQEGPLVPVIVQPPEEASPPPAANPWARRPACASMFLKSEWQLSGKQRACDWVQNRLFSGSAVGGAAASAILAGVRDSSAERGDPFTTRFGRRLVQSSLKSTGTFLGGVLLGEDPRGVPPYLVMQTAQRPRGFWRRTRHALANNVLSYDCVRTCSSEADIRRRLAFSRIGGAIGSGYGGELLTWDRRRSHVRAWRGAASAYGSSFVDALYTEFKPEVTAAAGKVFGGLFGVR